MESNTADEHARLAFAPVYFYGQFGSLSTEMGGHPPGLNPCDIWPEESSLIHSGE